MNYPTIQDLDKHYKGDALGIIDLRFTYPDSGDPLDFTGCEVNMQLRNNASKLAWTFSTETGDSLLTFTEPGVIRIEKIQSWDIAPATYEYDLQVTYPNGDIITYMRGKWAVNQDITWIPSI